MPTNPYQPPESSLKFAAKSDPNRIPHRRNRAAAMVACAVTILLAMTYTFLDEKGIGTRVGAWPMLFATSIISLIVAVCTKDVIFSPLCCFAGTMSGDCIAAMLRSVAYAQFHLCIPLALAFSFPALIVAAFRYRPSRVPKDFQLLNLETSADDAITV